MRRFLLLALPVILCAGEPAGPTVDEAAILVLANTHRAERGLYDNRALELVRSKQAQGSPQLMKFYPKASLVVPQLVANPQLTAAARALLAAGTRNPENAFFDAKAAIAKEGYPGSAAAIAVFCTDQPSLEAAYASTLFRGIERKDGKTAAVVPSASQLVGTTWREVGIAVTGGKGRYSLAMVFAMGSAKRHLGGVVYLDKERNLACDPGEGCPGVTVACGEASMVTGPGGVWWLPLAGEAAGEVRFTGGGVTAKRSFVAGPGNAVIDWRMPQVADQKEADRLIAAAEKAATQSDAEKQRPQLAALLIGMQLASLDDERQAKVDALLLPIREEFSNARGKLLAALADEPAVYKQAVADMQKSWKGVMPGWFKEAQGLGQLRQQVLAALAPKDAKPAAPVREALAKAEAASIDPVFRKQYAVMAGMLAEAPGEAAKGAK